MDNKKSYEENFLEVVEFIGRKRDELISLDVSQDDYELGLNEGRIDILTELEITMLRMIKREAKGNE